MDNFGSLGLIAMSKSSRKRRSNFSRRPTNEPESPHEYRDSISFSSTPPDHVSEAPSEGTDVHEALSRTLPYADLADSETMQKRSEEDGVLGEPSDLGRSNEANSTTAGQKSLKGKENKLSEVEVGSDTSGQSGTASDGFVKEKKISRVKLKVGGVTHTIHPRSSSDDSSVAGSGTSATMSRQPDAIYPSHIPSHQKNVNLLFMAEKGALRGVPWKDFSKIGCSFGKSDSFGVEIPHDTVNQALKQGRSCKKKSTVNKDLSDEEYDEEDDDEIRYLQKLKGSRVASYGKTEYEDKTRGKKLRKISRVMDSDVGVYAFGDYDSSRSGRESQKSRSLRASEDTDYLDEEESISVGEIVHENKKQSKVSTDMSEYSRNETSITTRRRATLTGRGTSPGLGANVIQFPDGLPPAPPRKPKEQLSEVAQQLKRAEAAQRRRIQNEKAARESEAEAIRKILGQDSSRKRREEKIKKRKEELAQERNMNAATVAPDVVRWVMGPSGTVVTFPDEMGLPSIFEPRPCSYPSPREKCAGPSCTNVYKYRDSKSNLPLCSLQCYKAVHGKTQYLPAC